MLWGLQSTANLQSMKPLLIGPALALAVALSSSVSEATVPRGTTGTGLGDSPTLWLADSGQRGSKGSRREGRITLDQAVRRIQRQTDGRILSARSVHEKGRTVYRIKVLTRRQRVRTYTVDAGGR